MMQKIRLSPLLLSIQGSIFFVIVIMLFSCSENKQRASVPYKILNRYFIKNDFLQHLPKDTVIVSLQQFEEIFGYGSVMGVATEKVDFENEMVVAIMQDETALSTQIELISVKEVDHELFIRYKIIPGDPQTFTMRPLLLLSVSNTYKGNVQFQKD
jgi:hypothetical protein